MKKTTTPKEIAEKYRQNGNSTWIIKSAIENPNCIIVAKNKKNAEELKRKYFEILERKEHPKFLSLNDNLEGYNLPIIFDNSALFDETD